MWSGKVLVWPPLFSTTTYPRWKSVATTRPLANSRDTLFRKLMHNAKVIGSEWDREPRKLLTPAIGIVAHPHYLLRPSNLQHLYPPFGRHRDSPRRQDKPK